MMSFIYVCLYDDDNILCLTENSVYNLIYLIKEFIDINYNLTGILGCYNIMYK